MKYMIKYTKKYFPLLESNKNTKLTLRIYFKICYQI